MKKVYLDYAATSYQRPNKVIEAMNNFFTDVKASPGRGGYYNSLKASRILHDARSVVKDFFKAPKSEQVIFTPGVTHSLNYAIKGLLKKNDHVISTTMEHNSVLRPLKKLENQGLITVDFIKCNHHGSLDLTKLKEKIKSNTKLIVLTHASNVTGTLFPIKKIADLCEKRNIIFVLDTAQTAGTYQLDLTESKIDVLAFTGHKALFGPPGTGGFIITEQVAQKLNTLIEGGTGSNSDCEWQPEFLPDKFESGTPNTPGIAGLKAGIEFIQQEGLEKIKTKKLKLKKQLITGLKDISKIEVLGPDSLTASTATISITVNNFDLGQLCYALDNQYGIMTRSGLHCAPLAHKTIGTYPTGSLRFSIGYFNTAKEIDYTLQSLAKLIQKHSSI